MTPILISRAAGNWRHLAWDRGEAMRLLKFGMENGASLWVWQLRTLVNPLLIAKSLGVEAAGIVALGIRVIEIADSCATSSSASRIPAHRVVGVLEEVGGSSRIRRLVNRGRPSGSRCSERGR